MNQTQQAIFPINVTTHRLLSIDGYGRFGTALTQALLEHSGFDLRVTLAELYDTPGWMHTLMGIDHSRLTLQLSPAWDLRVIPARVWAFSMYESTRIPDGWAARINDRAERMIAPCQWVADVFEGNGVTVPIHVIPGGTDVDALRVLPEVPRGKRPYTFLAWGDRGSRKGWDIAYLAFYEAFRADDDVALIVKARSPDILKQFPADGVRDPVSRKLRFWCGDVDDMRNVYAQADCMVFPSKAEGWGMPCREAAACGLPVIATDYSGMKDGIEHWAYPIREYKLVDSAELPTPHAPGRWARASVKEVAAHMRYCYEHRDDAREKGLAAAAWLRANQTWAHSAQALHDLITEIDIHQPNQLQEQWDAYRIEAAQSEQRFVEQVNHKEHQNGKNRTLVRTAQGSGRPLDGAGHLGDGSPA